MEKSSQIAWNIVPLRHFFPLKVVPLIEVLLYLLSPPLLTRDIKMASGILLSDLKTVKGEFSAQSLWAAASLAQRIDFSGKICLPATSKVKMSSTVEFR
jgi:hypothetical protein